MDALWQPSKERIESTNLFALKNMINDRHGLSLESFDEIHAHTVENSGQFWSDFWDFTAIRAETKGERYLINENQMPGAEFFPDAKMNYAENLLRRRDDKVALVFSAEGQKKSRMTYGELYDEVSKLQQVMKDLGVVEGDRIAGYLPNMPQSIIMLLAASSLGAIISTASPDFGVQGVLDRFGQIEPKLLFTTDGYWYNGKEQDIRGKVAEVAAAMPSFEKVIVAPLLSDRPDLSNIRDAVVWSDLTDPVAAKDIEFLQLPFSHPLYILFSSGTTGVPKCIVHRAGGSLLTHLREHMLHCNLKEEDRVFFFTTCGWMMWNWLVSGLAYETTLLLFDGSPFAKPDIVFDFLEEEKATHFGTSGKYIDAISKLGLVPKDSHDLSAIKTISSTGSPLVHEGFDYVYSSIKEDVCLASVSGGTDLVGCLVGCNPWGAVYRGQLMAPCLGMDIQVFNDAGENVVDEKGDLVCVNPFPSMPIGFWNDDDGQKYHSAYYDKFPNVWCHGDFIERSTETGGYIIYGRSDATLNPGGVRIGTAEIYRQV